ncbi:MAG TPA: hypothetical protein VKJ47_18345 [Candidatus Binatia bacterium]|nr:hypothetical protein [Candidatus Binatia bacterium]
MQQNHRRLVFSVLFLVSLCAGGLGGCSVFHATGRSVEAVGEGAGHAVAGTGRAVTNAASETKRDLTGY